MSIPAEEFKDEYYNKAKTWGDCERLVERLSPEQAEELHKAMRIVKAYTGLNERQKFYAVYIETIFKLPHEEVKEKEASI